MCFQYRCSRRKTLDNSPKRDAAAVMLEVMIWDNPENISYHVGNGVELKGLDTIPSHTVIISDHQRQKKPKRSTQFPPFIPPHLVLRIRGRTQRVGDEGALEDAVPILLQRPDVPVPDPIGAIVDLERRVRIPVVGGAHPLV